MSISSEARNSLIEFCHLLINQNAARKIVVPQAAESGFWFGGGNMIEDLNGNLYVVGRYRNAGDSRTGVAAGTRGLELAVFSSADKGNTFSKVVSWSKSDLASPTGEVLSIEGSCIRFTDRGVELFVSTEKAGLNYPNEVKDFLKPGAGVWTIDVLRAASVNELQDATVEPFVQSTDPRFLHIKDPFFWNTDSDSLGYCSHPFGWSSSNTGLTHMSSPEQLNNNVFPRGTTWDVAMTRGTCVLPVPALGEFADERHYVLFYCGGECLRPLDEHSTAVSRPRGYSCEEIGGAAVFTKSASNADRLSDLLPMFVSPFGTGCSRYVDVLATKDGFYATWQQSQADLSQPLVMNFVPRAAAEEVLN